MQLVIRFCHSLQLDPPPGLPPFCGWLPSDGTSQNAAKADPSGMKFPGVKKGESELLIPFPQYKNSGSPKETVCQQVQDRSKEALLPSQHD